MPAPVVAPPPKLARLFDRALEGGRSGLLEDSLRLRDFGRVYRAARDADPTESFPARALAELGVRFEIVEGALDHVPERGPVVLVANHPFGMLEGLVLFELMGRRRPDGRMLSNSLLTVIPEFRERVFAVDPYEREESPTANLSPLRAAIRHVRSGGMLGTFPSGEVAHSRLSRGLRVAEEAWSPTITKIVRAAGATVVPVHFEGANGRLFHLLGLLHPRVRTALLVRELLGKRGATVRVRIGRPIPPSTLRRAGGPAEQAAWLRLRTLELGLGTPAAPRRTPRRAPPPPPSPVIDAVPPAELAAEVAALPAARHLDSAGALSVVLARAAETPAVMREIARLREITFRAVGEGTGRPLDRDRFDEHYWQLFLWNRESREIAGAYRLGATDEILPRFGTRGLYTTTLFGIPRRLLDGMGPALEMGRSFVREEYQRSYPPLALLWKGIGRFVVANPRYRVLFGPVTISSSYRATSTRMIREFLRQNGYWSDLARLVRPRRPPRPVRDRDVRACGRSIGSIEDVSRLVAEIEPDGKGVPVLLRQYLKLGARFLGFNIDPDFGDALDGLVTTDLVRTEPRILAHYMGRDGARSFLAHHGVELAETAPEPAFQVA